MNNELTFDQAHDMVALFANDINYGRYMGNLLPHTRIEPRPKDTDIFGPKILVCCDLHYTNNFQITLQEINEMAKSEHFSKELLHRFDFFLRKISQEVADDQRRSADEIEKRLK